jgi:hypothetical protein
MCLLITKYNSPVACLGCVFFPCGTNNERKTAIRKKKADE